MEFEFSRQNLKGRERFLERLFEILPGLTSWVILIGMCTLSFWKPLVAAILIIAFDFYWLLRLFYMTLFLILAYFRLSVEQSVDWMARVRDLDRLIRHKDAQAWMVANDEFARPDPYWKKAISFWIHKRKIDFLKQSGSLPPLSSEIYHLVIYSVAKEGKEIVEPGIRALSNQKYMSKHILLVIALEERAEKQIKDEMNLLRDQYRDFFFEFLIIEHPDELPGEARVKGANVTHAAKQAASYFEGKQIPLDHIIVSCFDADTVVHSDYFSCLTYHFMVYPRRDRASFQPIPVYHNNIWEASAFARVLDIGSSFFQLIEATNPERLVTFSSHSMSFKALVEVGYWPRNMISDDSAIFWKSFLHFDGDYRVVPMYTTLSMDVVAGKNWFTTAANVYRQKRRWAWGVENFPIVMRGFFKNNMISPADKIRFSFKLFEDNVAWATWAFLITVIGWLPALFAGREFSDTVLYYSAPRITGTIFNLALLALLATIILSQLLLPPKKVRFHLMKRIWFALEWLFVPIIVVFLSAIPALDAQTRLMFGNYMEFWVTEKKRR